MKYVGKYKFAFFSLVLVMFVYPTITSAQGSSYLGDLLNSVQKQISNLKLQLSASQSLASLNQNIQKQSLAAQVISATPLSKGSKGPAVKALQMLLLDDKTANYSTDAGVTGYFGSATESAVKNVQQNNKIPVTGVVDAKTVSFIKQTRNPGSPDNCVEGYCLPRDAEGWTILNPTVSGATASHLVYVSNSNPNSVDSVACQYNVSEIQGSWDNPTGSLRPGDNGQLKTCKTLTYASQLVRGGFPDYLLLRKGDVFVEDPHFNSDWHYFSGPTPDQPSVITSYGPTQADRPTIRTDQGVKFGKIPPWAPNPNASPSNIALVGIAIRSLTGSGSTGAGIGGMDENILPSENVLIEDNLVEGFGVNISIQGANINNVTIRRNIVYDAFAIPSHSQGLGMFNVKHVLIEENVFDHNGYREDWPYPLNYVVLPNSNISEWSAVTNGEIAIDVNYNAPAHSWTRVNVTGINFSGVTSMSDIASRIQTAINSAYGTNIISVSSFVYPRNGLTYFIFRNTSAITIGNLYPYPAPSSGISLFQNFLRAGDQGYPHANEYRHNLYLGFGNTTDSNYVVRNNIIMRGDGGKYAPTNITIDNNTYINNAIAVFACCQPNAVITNNVISDGDDYFTGNPAGGIPRGGGIWVIGYPLAGQYGPLEISNNIIANQHSAQTFNVSAIQVADDVTNLSLRNNIIYNWIPGANGWQTRGGGIIFSSSTTNTNINVSDNIVQQPNGGSLTSLYTAPNPGEFTFLRNKYFTANSGGSGDLMFQWNGVLLRYNTGTPNWLSMSGETGSSFGQVQFLDPNRDPSTYLNSLGLGNYAFKSDEGVEAFATKLKSLRKGNWDTRFTAKAYNDYIRAGFEFSSSTSCRADMNGDGVLSAADYTAFSAAYTTGDMRADFDNSGSLNINDYMYFMNAYAVGCN